MKRGEITTVEKLIPGDRFYKASSRDKKPLELVGPESYGKFEAIPDGMGRNRAIVIKGSTTVVYLRNVNNAS